MLIAKARQTVGHVNHSSKSCVKLKKTGHFRFISVNEKSLTTSARCWNKAKLNLPYAKNIRKIRINVQKYLANNKLKNENILTADEWKLVSFVNYLLDPFCKVTLPCSKNNSLLSSVIPHAAIIKMFFHYKANSPPGQSSSQP